MLTPLIAADELRRHVLALSADDMEGRQTGMPGSHRASEYVAKSLAAVGVPPAGDDGSYFQRVPLVRVAYDSPPKLALVGADGAIVECVPGRDFTWSGPRPFPATAASIVRVTRADEIPAEPMPETALFLDMDRPGSRGLFRDRELATPGRFALILARGPAVLGDELTKPPVGGWLALYRQGPDGARIVLDRAEVPRTQVLWIRDEFPDRLADGEFTSAAYVVEQTYEEVLDRNVVARIVGRGTPEQPELAKETIVFTAHFDHIGIRPLEAWESEDSDWVYNGADDDASGVAAILELAGAWAVADPPPVRTLVFLLVTGEEVGLLGTEYYLDHPVQPLADTVLNLNFEMIGRPDPEAGGEGKLWLTGSEDTTLLESFEAAGVVEDPRPDQHFFKRSDNWAFVERGLVGQTLSSYNMHRDYHKETDEAELLDYDHMETGVRTAFEAMRPFVEGEVRPQWNEGVDPGKL